MPLVHSMETNSIAENSVNRKAVFHEKWFNPLYFVLLNLERDYPKVKHVYIYGGKSSTKTYTVAQFCEVKATTEGKSTLAFRKVSDRMNETLIATFKKAVKSTRLSNGLKAMDKELRGAHGHIKFKGLDSEDSAKGVEGYSYLLFDELDQFTEEEYEETRISFRGEIAKYFFSTWNPVSERLWIKPYLDRIEWLDTPYKLPSPESFIKVSADGSRLLVKTDYQDNYWTVGSPDGSYGYKDESLIRDYENLKTYNYNKYRVVVLGEWGVTEVKSPAIQNFDKSRHVGKAEYNQMFPLIFAVDFNTMPLACTVWQEYKVGNEHKIRCIREIALENAKTQDLINFIQRNYTPMELSRAFFTGDATGRTETTANLSNWLQIDNHFRLGKRLHLPSVNPHVLTSLEHCDFVLHRHKDLIIDESCHHLIFELEYTEKDDKGLVKKSRTKAEQKADFLDTMRYMFNYYFLIRKDITTNPIYYNV